MRIKYVLAYIISGQLVAGQPANQPASNMPPAPQAVASAAGALMQQATAVTPFSIQSLTAQLKDKNPTSANPLFVGYQPMQAVRPNRDRIAIPIVNTQMEQLRKKKQSEDGGNSSIAAANPFPVVVAQFESLLPAEQNKLQEPFAVLLLGDHELFRAAESIGNRTVPLQVVGTFVGAEKDFWDKAINSNNWVYKQIPPRQFTQLKGDANLFFISLITRTNTDKKTSTGAEYPVLIAFDPQFKVEAGDSIRPDVPFQNLVVADMLREAGVNYSPEMGTNLDSDPLKSLVEKARVALVAKVKALRSDPRTSNEYGALIKVVPERTKWSDINAGALWSYKGEKL